MPFIRDKLKACRLGLGYVRIGRYDLSGGEAQRVKLSKELSDAPLADIYILDEPTTGRFADIAKLLGAAGTG